MRVYFRGQAFAFQPNGEDTPFEGRLQLDDGDCVRLRDLMEREDEGWRLDADGERLPPDKLLAASPWSCDGPSGPVKLLLRWLDLREGTVVFNAIETYGGEAFRWTRPDQ